MNLVELVTGVQLCIPLYVVISYVTLISLCLLLHRIQLGLAISFVLILYMGYFYNRQLLLKILEGSVSSVMIYVGLGFVIVVLAFVAFLTSHK
jgi:hypothetical protein